MGWRPFAANRAGHGAHGPCDRGRINSGLTGLLSHARGGAPWHEPSWRRCGAWAPCRDLSAGDGPFDLVLVPGFVSQLDLQMEWPLAANFFNFSRLDGTWSHDGDLVNAASHSLGTARTLRPCPEAIAPVAPHRPLAPVSGPAHLARLGRERRS